ncbi:OmpA family protein [Dyadobacter tibetensis]|uniref:OmpA family protein n=1 Tax=Dyadobacter tibetensis TaxID=1211851 RepID=UPI00046F2F12|nr:OmpA family protein [Dyadobacter tibetensis]
MLRKSAFWWSSLVLWIIIATYWHVCHIRQNCESLNLEIPSLFSAKEAKYSLSNSQPIAENKPNIEQNTILFPASQATRMEHSGEVILDSIARHLSLNPDQRLMIRGSYHTSETNPGAFPNLGLARAFHIKEILSSKGVDPAKIRFGSDSISTTTPPDNIVKESITFNFYKREASTETDLASDQTFTSIFNKIELYFPYASINYIQTVENRKFLEAAKAYLAKPGNRKLVITGHTDNEDSAEWNMQLSIKRANAVKNKLLKLGIPADRMRVVGKGETEPKASNSTIEGRRANRRVSLVVQ